MLILKFIPYYQPDSRASAKKTTKVTDFFPSFMDCRKS